MHVATIYEIRSQKRSKPEESSKYPGMFSTGFLETGAGKHYEAEWYEVETWQKIPAHLTRVRLGCGRRRSGWRGRAGRGWSGLWVGRGQGFLRLESEVACRWEGGASWKGSLQASHSSCASSLPSCSPSWRPFCRSSWMRLCL